MTLARISWFIIVLVLIVSVAVPAMREQWQLSVLLQSEEGDRKATQEFNKQMEGYHKRAPKFVAEKYPNDTRMLMAAGLLRHDIKLLQQAAEKGQLPVAWSAYLIARVQERGTLWDNIAFSGVDPGDPKQIAEEQSRLIKEGLPSFITPEIAAPSLSLLHAWQQSDPQNGLPVACEAICLYGMKQRDKALARWSYASSLPDVDDYGTARVKAIYELLTAMGAPAAFAWNDSFGFDDTPANGQLRSGARMALYEGRLARLEGRPEDAIAWWRSTVDFGQHMSETADNMISMLVGSAVMGIGGGAIWQWVPDKTAGLKDGPLYNGRLFWGSQHDFWLQQVGPEKDQALRDTLIRSKLRSYLSRPFISKFSDSYASFLGYLESGYISAAWFVIFLLVFIVFCTWRRRTADNATQLSMFWQIGITILILMPIAVMVINNYKRYLVIFDPEGDQAEGILGLVTGIVFVVFLLALPPLAALRSRTPGVRFRTAWRGNLRRILPVAMALCALAYVPLSLMSIREITRFTRQWTDPKYSEMAVIKSQLGDKWTNPPIPKDAWRAEYPPEKTE